MDEQLRKLVDEIRQIPFTAENRELINSFRDQIVDRVYEIADLEDDQAWELRRSQREIDIVNARINETIYRMSMRDD